MSRIKEEFIAFRPDEGIIVSKGVFSVKQRRKWIGIITICLIVLVAAVFLGGKTESKGSKHMDRSANEISVNTPDTGKDIVGQRELTDITKSLYQGVADTMPQLVVDELKKNRSGDGVRQLVDEDTGTVTYSLSNQTDQQDETLRLDFSYQSDHLVQYRSKEYGFVDSLPREKIKIGTAKELVIKFAETFLDKKFIAKDIKKTAGYSGYETKEYVTLQDSFGNTYLVQLSHNMVIKYDMNKEQTTWTLSDGRATGAKENKKQK